jgi:hypothetical protein
MAFLTSHNFVLKTHCCRTINYHDLKKCGQAGRGFLSVSKTFDFSDIRGDQEGLFKLVMLNFIFKCYNWSNFRLLTASK